MISYSLHAYARLVWFTHKDGFPAIIYVRSGLRVLANRRWVSPYPGLAFLNAGPANPFCRISLCSDAGLAYKTAWKQ